MISEKHEYPTVYDLHMALSAYARESRAPFQQLRQGLQEVVRRIYSDAPLLEQELKEIQRRLGTPDERPEDAARRELAEETGLIWEGEMVPVGAFGNPGRDPRGWNVSATYLADIGLETPTVVGGDDAADARWCFADDLPKEMAFDHAEIITVALVRLGCE